MISTSDPLPSVYSTPAGAFQDLLFPRIWHSKVTRRCVDQSARSTVEYCMGYKSLQHFLAICSYMFLLHVPTACSCLTLLLLHLHGLLHFTEFAHIIVHLSRSTRCKIATSRHSSNSSRVSRANWQLQYRPSHHELSARPCCKQVPAQAPEVNNKYVKE